MANPIGVIEGRLLPKYKGRYQAHPVGYWADEFPIAADLGLNCIEFILDQNDMDQNPLMSDAGVQKMQAVITETGVSVISICADNLMEAPLHSADEDIVQSSSRVMDRLMQSAATLSVKDIVIPCVDQSSLGGADAEMRFVANMAPFVAQAEKMGINLSLETDLPPGPFAALLDRMASPRVTVNYDIGNSASLGFDPREELSSYGARITDIHIKDRTLGGGPVELGQGDADFDAFFEGLKAFDYVGPFVMQAYRDDEGVEMFKRQLDWISPYLETYR